MSETNVHAAQPVEHYGADRSTADRVAVVVHGRGQRPAWMREFLIDRLDAPSVCFVAPAAAGDTWYPGGFMQDPAVNEPQLGWALDVIDHTVEALVAEGRARDEIVLCGFSQGACLLSEYVSRRPDRYGGVAVLTGGLIGPPGTRWDGGSLHGTPVLLATSDIDEWVPLPRVEETRDVLSARDASVTYRVYEGMEHVINDDEVELVGRLLGGEL